jgi:hypothetical protein
MFQQIMVVVIRPLHKVETGIPIANIYRVLFMFHDRNWPNC